MSEAEKMASAIEQTYAWIMRNDLDVSTDDIPDDAIFLEDAATLIRRLVAEKAKLVEAARPFAYLAEGDFYPTKCEVERLRATIEGK